MVEALRDSRGAVASAPTGLSSTPALAEPDAVTHPAQRQGSGLVESLSHRASAPSDVSGVTVEATPAPLLSPAVLTACKQYSYGDRNEERANRAVAIVLAEKGASDARIITEIRKGAGAPLS